MRPLFTIHVGEYLVGAEVEKMFRNYRVWVPVTDTGIDLLISNPAKRSSVGLQVKFSKDFYTKEHPLYEKKFVSFGWWTLQAKKIRLSPADLWVFVLYNFNTRVSQYIVIAPGMLLRKLIDIYGNLNSYRIYLILTKDGKCWDIRGLKKAERKLVTQGKFLNQRRDFSQYIASWDQLKKKLDRIDTPPFAKTRLK